MQKNARKIAKLRAGSRELFYDKGPELLDESVSVLAVDLQGKGLGKIQAENAEDRLCVYNEPSTPQINIIIVFSCDIYELLYVFGHFEVDHYRFHTYLLVKKCLVL